MQFFAPAKINLTLHITGKREDGYHLLDSLVVFLDFGDELTVTDADETSLELRGAYADLISAEDNLVLRAVRLLQSSFGVARQVRITLKKNIPVGAGLGGGSADAAATLRALNQHWRLGLAMTELARLGAELGSDVPACVLSRPVWLSGVGDTLEPAVLDYKSFLLLAYPAMALPTVSVYRAFSALQPPVSRPDTLVDEEALLGYLARARNDLTSAAVSLCPAVGVLLNALAETKGTQLVRMSGSGAACFALYRSMQEAEAAQQQLSARFMNYWFQPCRMVAHGQA
ncbi:MAG: 4-(cytidine 5'-diphospho)-2-C-methyl-D-erythritol kinase [Alphaproteobacteria bacterium]|nr:4-(cytidine 5'-diphospho)-2-C-methyl-D-erythritol kinase [Alphaproteobacteria bacterium]